MKEELYSQSSPVKKECFESLADIETSCDTAISILNDLLSYEKLEAGILQLEKIKMCAWPLIKNTVHPFFIQVRNA